MAHLLRAIVAVPEVQSSGLIMNSGWLTRQSDASSALCKYPSV